MTRILAGTRDGLHVFEDGRAAEVARIGRSPPDAARPVTALARAGSELWSIVDRHEVWRTDDDAWTHVVSVGNLDLECRRRDGRRRHRRHVGGTSVPRRRSARAARDGDRVRRGPGAGRWYTPWGGPPATRSISEDDDAVHVNVHVGGIARSRDRGRDMGADDRHRRRRAPSLGGHALGLRRLRSRPCGQP